MHTATVDDVDNEYSLCSTRQLESRERQLCSFTAGICASENNRSTYVQWRRVQ